MKQNHQEFGPDLKKQAQSRVVFFCLFCAWIRQVPSLILNILIGLWKQPEKKKSKYEKES